MKRNTFILLGLLVFLTCCTNRRNFEDFGKSTLNAIIDNDHEAIKDLYEFHMNKTSDYSKNKLKSLFKEWKNKKIDYLEVDTSSFLGSLVTTKYLEVYFKVDTMYYTLEINYTKNKKEELVIKELNFSNLSQSCKDWETNDYRPEYGIKFGEIRSFSNDEYIKSAYITLENLLDHDVNYVKFKLNIHDDYYAIFNKTIIYNKPLYKGDVEQFYISELENYYVGYNVQNEKNIRFKIELIKVLPKPEQSITKVLARLKKKYD